MDDAPLTDDEFAILRAAGYKPSGGGLYDDVVTLHFVRAGEKRSATRAEWRAVIAELNMPFDRIAPALCKHHRTLFISSERGPDGRRAYAFLCKNCGTFVVSINGERMAFTLCTDEQVEAAGVCARLLKGTDERKNQ